MNAQISLDSRSLELAHQLEISILAERREDLLWKTTQDDRHKLQKKREIEEAIVILDELPKTATSPGERNLIEKIKKSFDVFRGASISDPASPVHEIRLLADDLLQTVEKFREQKPHA